MAQLFFILLVAGATAWFVQSIRKIIRNISFGIPFDRTDNPSERWKTMIRVALGQSKMVSRPIPAILHLFVYVGFVLINIEVLEMFVDGTSGGHRSFSFLGGFYSFLIGFFEVLAFLVTLGCFLFFIRRNVLHIQRLRSGDLNGWPRSDANIILISEMVLMTALFIMNASDSILQTRPEIMHHYKSVGMFPISSFIAPLLSNLSSLNLVILERSCWWFHIIGILAFLNYLPYSKHFHIVMAFPNTYYSKLAAVGQLTSPENIQNEVKAMLDPSFVPPAPTEGTAPLRFGAKDITDLSRKQLMDAYTCTECGRCTSSCPANQTGKLLSPRKIMMNTRDRIEELGHLADQNKGVLTDDGKSLFNYITPEEIWACTTCNACVQECPVNIDPVSIIIELRRYLVMEQSQAPSELNQMLTNIENNGAPWQFSGADRLNWQ